MTSDITKRSRSRTDVSEEKSVTVTRRRERTDRSEEEAAPKHGRKEDARQK